ncbi:MAG: T9SS type A sorting domain-containing protein, partial [Bacteroidales bacterium]|nr:T9SS type A sorting domain-containing protein [Bacteroidales bacterium]
GEEEVRIYPNPTGGDITVSWENDYESLLLTIYDLYGRVVKVVKIGSGKNEVQVDISEVIGGLYIFELKDAEFKIISRARILKR